MEISHAASDLEKMQSLVQPDLKLYQKVKRTNRIHLTVITLFALLLCVCLYFSIADFFKASSLIIGIIFIAIVWVIGVILYAYIIKLPIDIMLFNSVKKQLKNNLPECFNIGTAIPLKSPPGLFAIDYDHRILAMITYDEKYKPYFIPADVINAVNVQNNREVTTKTEYSSLKDEGKTTTNSKDNYYVEIHYQMKGKQPSWIRIPFAQDRTEAQSIASAILKM